MLTYLKEKNIPFKPVLKELWRRYRAFKNDRQERKLNGKLPETYGGFDETMTTYEPENKENC